MTLATKTASSPTSVAAIPSESTAGESSRTEIEASSNTHPSSCSRGSSNSVTMSRSPRTCILGVGASAGRLCGVAMNLAPDGVYTNSSGSSNININSGPLSAGNAHQLTDALNDLMANLCATASSLNLNWVRSIRAKMALNEKKYPVEHCKGKAGKYTKYSHLTGVTTTNQSTRDFVDRNDGNENENETGSSGNASGIRPSAVSLPDFADDHLVELSEFIAAFATERLWARYHTPRNLVLALLGEAGELAELLQWNGDQNAEPDAETLDKLSQELADVSIYAIRLATVCGVVEDLRESLKQRASIANGDAS